MQVSYFAMPLSICGLAVAFKLASGLDLSRPLCETRVLTLVMASQGVMEMSPIRSDLKPTETYFHTLTIIAAVVFVIFFLLYMIRLVLHSRKCSSEWDDPMRSPSFGAISLFLMLFAFLIFDINADGKTTMGGMMFDGDEPVDDKNWEWFARVIFWLGAITHILLTIAKFGEWVGKRLEMEHVHPTWMMLPVGCLVAAMVSPDVLTLKMLCNVWN